MQQQPEPTRASSDLTGTNSLWPEHYFSEMDPAKRKEILDAEAKAGNPDASGILLDLFQKRYEKKRDDFYADRFLGAFLVLKRTAENLDSMFSENKNRRAIQDSLHDLCLDASSPYPDTLLYREMCQLTERYITLCLKDKNYSAILWGLGKISDKKTAAKINLDLERVGEAIPKYMDMEKEFTILKKAILATKSRYV